MCIDNPQVLLVTDAETGTICEHARSNVHTHQFLEKKLGSIRYLDLGDLGLVVARPAFVVAFLDLSTVC